MSRSNKENRRKLALLKLWTCLDPAPVPTSNPQNSRAFLVEFLWCLRRSEHGGAAAQSLWTLSTEALTADTVQLPDEGGLQPSTICQSQVTQRMPTCQGMNSQLVLGWATKPWMGARAHRHCPGVIWLFGGYTHLGLEKKIKNKLEPQCCILLMLP